MATVVNYIQFSSVQFYLAKINYDIRMHIKIVSWQARVPRRNQKAYEAWAPSHKEISKVKIRGQ